MPEVHNPNFVGPIELLSDEGLLDQLLTSAGPGGQVVWSSPPVVLGAPAPACVTASQRSSGLILGTDLSGNQAWVRDKSWNYVSTSFGDLAVMNPNLDTTNFWLLGSNTPATATLLFPFDDCSQSVIRIKNIGLGDFTITSPVPVDGLLVFVLKGLSFGAHPFGSWGGDAVTLVYNFVLSAWHIISVEVA
jgi:hypothetical protein